jgi:serine/threonine-protein kinase
VAPEQIAGAPANPAADIYSATATFYECIVGHPPFSGEADDLLRKHRLEPVPLAPVPEPLRPLIVAGMEKDPGLRPADASTFVAQLKAVASASYSPGWEDRGRTHLGEASFLLADLWPSGSPPVVQGAAVHPITPPRRLNPVRVAIVVSVATGIAAVGTAVAVNSSHRSNSSSPPVTVPLSSPPYSSPPYSSPPYSSPPYSSPPYSSPPYSSPPYSSPPYSSPPYSSPPYSSPPETSVTVTINADAGFIDTGITVGQGETVTITASGSWTPDGVNWTDPDGFDSSMESADNYLNLTDLGACSTCARTQYPEYAALMSYTGDNSPQPGSYTSTSVASQAQLIDYVGSDLQTAGWPYSGELWLGMNDDAYSGNTSDNSGSVTATITVGG